MSPATPRSASARARAQTKAPRVPKERTHFKELLLANHFGTVAASDITPKAPAKGNTTYEQLMCVGYQPALRRLDAVVNVKQNAGYNGGLCSTGSREYVKFFVSTDGGVTWDERGTVSFPVWDTPSPKPLEYVATLFEVDLPEECCREENVVLVRAILSWEVPPGGPDDPVVWGNALDANIQVAPLAVGTIFEAIQCLDLKIDKQAIAQILDAEQPVVFGGFNALTPVQLHEAYRGTKVPPHRYLLPQLTELLEQPAFLTEKLSKPDFELFPGVEVDITKLIGIVVDPQGNRTYEQLGCVGLNENTNELVATIDVKLSSGYSGGLCTNGSQEYVAFWVDWEDGSGFHYAGTTSVNVHDIAAIPAGGLQYSAALPYPAILSRRRPCADGPVTAIVRAVLSWATPPSTTDPFAVPVWGGHAQTRILLPPGEIIVGGGPIFEWIGSMPVGDIDVSGRATGSSILGFSTSNSPFGGRVAIAGHVINPATSLPGGPGYQYRVLISTDGGGSWNPLTAPVPITLMSFPSGTQTNTTVTPSSQGWTPYLANFSGGLLQQIVGDVLGYYHSVGEGQTLIKLEARDGSLNPLGAVSKLIQLDNTAPTSFVSITSGGGSCGDFKVGDTITGFYETSDNDFVASVGLSLEPTGGSFALSPSTVTPTFQDGTWTLHTAGLPPCGYVVRFDGGDRTIVNSGSLGWDGPAFTGFCLKK